MRLFARKFVVLYCIWIFIWRFSRCKPNRSAFGAFQFQEKVRLKARERERDKKRGAARISERKWRGRWFQIDGPIEAKDLVWAMVVLTRCMKGSWRWEEKIRRREGAEIGGRIWSQMYKGLSSKLTFRAILNSSQIFIQLKVTWSQQSVHCRGAITLVKSLIPTVVDGAIGLGGTFCWEYLV